MCDCTCFVCAQPYMDQIKNIFVLFIFFWNDLYHPCFSKFFKLILCEKHVFWVFSRLISWVSSVASLDREFRECFTSYSWEGLTRKNSQLPMKIPNYLWNFQISFLKGILWNICFKLLTSSPNPLFQSFYIKTLLNSIVFHSINISKVIFNSFHWFDHLIMFLGGLCS